MISTVCKNFIPLIHIHTMFVCVQITGVAHSPVKRKIYIISAHQNWSGLWSPYRFNLVCNKKYLKHHCHKKPQPQWVILPYIINVEQIGGLVQDCSNSRVLAMELLQSCTATEPWIIFSVFQSLTEFLNPMDTSAVEPCLYTFMNHNIKWVMESVELKELEYPPTDYSAVYFKHYAFYLFSDNKDT